MDRQDQERHLRETFRLARGAREEGNHPFGAVLVAADGAVLAAANTVRTDNDPLGHAELNLVRRAVREWDVSMRRQATLFSSTEPCAMCAGAIYWAGIRRVVYGLAAEELGRLTHASLVVPCRTIFAHARDRVEVTGPLLADEALQVHEGFWNQA